MAASSTATTIISCCCCCRRRLGPPAPRKEPSAAAGARRPQAASVSVSSAHALRRACVAAAACAVMGMAGGMAPALARDGAVAASRTDDAVAVGAARVKAPPPRWSDRRQCPPWRANSLENIVPENLPRPSARSRFDSVSASAAAPDLAAAAPPSFLALRPGTVCFSL